MPRENISGRGKVKRQDPEMRLRLVEKGRAEGTR